MESSTGHVLSLGGALRQAIEPMEARLVTQLPEEGEWQFEPKWDGFRAIAVRDGDKIAIWSKSGKPLDRYFPELRSAFLTLPSARFIVDGEILIPIAGLLSFGALQARLHPAESRIKRLSHETPAQFMLFDILHDGDRDLADAPLAERRVALERFHAMNHGDRLLLSPCSRDAADARAWLAAAGGALDGVVAKPLDLEYRFGERAMAKVKQHRTADCVVGGFRRTADGKGVASLLLGLYDEEGLLDHVGFTSGIAADERRRLLDELGPLIEVPGFTGKAPGGPSRWSGGKATPWSPLRPCRVVEVGYDQVTDRRFRHGTTLLRWRPDKRPDQCAIEQLHREISPKELKGLLGPLAT